MTIPTEDQMHANYTHALRRLGTMAPGGSSAELGPWWLMYSGLPAARFNIGVPRARPDSPRDAVALAERWFEQRGATTIRLDLRYPADVDLIAASELDGYERWWVEPAMSLAPLPKHWPGLPAMEVRPVLAEDDVKAYANLGEERPGERTFQAALTRSAMKLPGCVLLLGRAEGKPVARSMAVVVGAVVGVHNVFVPDPLRRNGYGAAITAAAIDAGREMGATAACLEATELGEPVYRRMGFIHRYDYVSLGRHLP